MPWNPEQYHKFQSERSAPFFDLLNLVQIKRGLNVIDLGCGTGELTKILAQRLPESEVLGIDNSGSMLAKAKPLAHENLRFEQASIEEIKGQWDVVFSNAAIQWVENHNSLIPKLFSLVKPGGQLVVQLPSNHMHPSHTFILEIARTSPFKEALKNWVRISPVLMTEQYATHFYELGAEEINVFEKIYPHVLENSDAIAEWTSGTALVPYFERLTQSLKDSFMSKYRAKLGTCFPESPVFYPFRRILFAATRPKSL
ncbi:methyltransferase domain-containing protein [Candidatus Acetothermia bacterium]|nr:methyltransferase domain-containing protein [Candidatus Acetothermia bacterium]MBI3643148.1 methyltransferase domain-containing protein [Candidatus Acetothermia bacterium]